MSAPRGLWAAAVATLFTLTACEGPMGPEGPQGIAGTPGADANETCTDCHTDDVGLYAKQVQYAQSTHRLGGNFERSTTACAPCHTHQGFLERIASGATTTAADIVDPAPVNCRTCHKIHDTYTDADWALTSTATVTLHTGSGTLDLGANVGNLCAQCHQSRALDPMPTVGGPSVTITSMRYGFHHGPQAQVVGGVGAFEFAGSKTITGGPHDHGNKVANPDLCGSCHMAQAYGQQAGGHTWKMSYDYHGSEVENIAGCNVASCHGSNPVDDFDKANVQTDVETLLDDISVELKRLGIQRADGYAVTGAWPGDLVAAFANWQMFEEDRSQGIHNPGYAIAVLTNTLEVLKTK